MIDKGFCMSCGSRFDKDPRRQHDEIEHYDCRENSKILEHLGISKEDLERMRKGEYVHTTEKYWDCECRKNYIHLKSHAKCDACGAFAEDQPDSRINEVFDHGLSLR